MTKESLDIYFEEDGHLSSEGRARYADAVQQDRLEILPEEVVNHVQNCIKCATEIEHLFSLSQPFPSTTTHKIPHSITVRRSFWGIPYYKLAASILLLIVLGVYLFYVKQQYTSAALFQKYYDLPIASDNRGAVPSANTEDFHAIGMEKYRTGDFSGAVEALKKADSANMYTRFYLAHAYLNQNEAALAIEAFEYVLKNTDQFDYRIQLALALTHLKAGKTEKALKHLNALIENPEADEFYRRQAIQIAEDMSSFWYRP